MSNNTLIYGAGAIASYYLLTQKKEPKIPNQISIEVIPAATGGPTIIDPPGGGLTITGTNVETITATSQPDFENWQRPQWSAYLMAKINASDLETASPILWNQWNDSRNPQAAMFPSLNSFIFNLITYQVANNIGEIITADSVPVYGTLTNWWNGLQYWNCTQWREWFELNLQVYGTSQARAKFIDAWSHGDNHSWWSDEPAGILCGYDCDFINYFRSKGLDVARVGAQNTCTLITIPTNLIDATAAVGEGVKNTANTISFLLPVTIVTITGLYIYTQYKKAQ